MGFLDKLEKALSKSAASPKVAKAVEKKVTKGVVTLTGTIEGRSKTVEKRAPNPKLISINWHNDIKQTKFGKETILNIKTSEAVAGISSKLVCYALVIILDIDSKKVIETKVLDIARDGYTIKLDEQVTSFKFIPKKEMFSKPNADSYDISAEVFLFHMPQYTKLSEKERSDSFCAEQLAAYLKGEKKPYTIFDSFYYPRAVGVSKKTEKLKVVDKKIVIVIDPGHGDHNSNNRQIDPGTCSTDNKELEKDYALILSLALKREMLKDEKYSIFLTRDADIIIKKPAVNWRSEIANEKKGDVFISFHLNSGTTKDIFVVYQQGKNNEKESISLGDKITLELKEIVQLSNKPVRSAVEATRYTTVGVLNQFKGKAGVLFEFGGIDSVSNLKNIKENKESISRAIKKGIEEFIYENL